MTITNIINNDLTITNHSGVHVVDSRDVAVMVEKRHSDLLRDIIIYEEYLTNAKVRSLDFFIPSTYQDAKGETRPNRLMTKKGCDMVANKMTGEKGVLFTANYVTKFDEMEKAAKETRIAPRSIEELIIMQAQSVMDLKNKVEEHGQLMELQSSDLTTLNHRVDNIDSLDIIGDLRQRLNKMVQKYAHQNRVAMSDGWKVFTQRYNTAFRTNLTTLKNNYQKNYNLSKLTAPEYLELTGKLEDAIRVADKMLNHL